jgi:F0F1-type ATP synthase assembly protein I
VAIPLSFVVILNWWHVWNYTDFTFNWKSVLEFPLFRVIYYVLEPVCTVFEFVNYYLLNVRMDADVDPRWREAMRAAWDYRPLTFTALYLVVAGTLVSSPVGKWIVDVLTGGGGLFWAVLPATIFAFFYLNLNVVRLAMFQFYFGHILVVVFALLLMLLFTMVFANVLTPFYVIYMLGMSYFSLPLFQGTNAFAKVSEIFSDLREAPVEGDPQGLWNFLFRNCFGIFMVVGVLLPLLSYHFVELGRIQPSPRLASAMTLVNVGFLILLSLPFWGTLNEFRSVLVKALGTWLGLKGFGDLAEVNEADIQL